MIPKNMNIKSIKGKVFCLPDNIDTDQIIPANYLNLVPTKPDEYQKLGSYALIGLPDSFERFVKEGQLTTEFTVILAGKNFGCGSSREHAPICLGATGCRVVIAQSYARIFFRNCMSTGELFPVEYDEDLDILPHFKTGDEVEVNLVDNTLTHCESKIIFPLNDAGDAKEVIVAGGLFEFARANGIVKS